MVPCMSFTHHQLWSAIDLAALRCGMTTSAFARHIGLDKTSLNKSKRIDPRTGDPRWVTMEVIALITQRTDISFKDFADMVESQPREPSPAP